ncbi:MAG TPA: methylmalonyl-CoA epimerase [Desulfotomaculum sp.]|nr:methylmalonyl-CoA epimerase [Desulfotomaculum sp.]HBY04328.1 methylmalonyl-CoA epimerase [Desulfotomaculum sp.]
MKLEKIDHICIAVKDVKKAEELFAGTFDLRAVDHYIDEKEKISVARFMIGEVAFELMESTSPDGEVARFIEKNGEGMFLISFKVPDVEGSMEELNKKGLSPIDKKPRNWCGRNFTFLHPKDFAGVLIELIE